MEILLLYFISRLFNKCIFLFLGGGWSAKVANPDQFISITFYNTIVVKGIITAGRTDVDEWVSQYKLQYQESYFSEWLNYYDPPGTVKVRAEEMYTNHSDW